MDFRFFRRGPPSPEPKSPASGGGGGGVAGTGGGGGGGGGLGLTLGPLALTGPISGIAQITPSLFLSSGNIASDRQAVYSRGITCVVNATVEMSSPRWPDVEVVRVPLPDVPHAPLSLYFDTVGDKIRQVSRRNGRTLVHCVAGVSRSPTLCIAYLMKHQRRSLLQAHDWVRSRRPVIRPNLGFWRQLVDYERRLFGKNTVSMVPTAMGMAPDVYQGQVPQTLASYWAFR
ncbi:dual specificity protein phosphatase 14-like [Leucoraja erinacea]|uniref:dual specificity protein phosphatase 14-like n=1 Tax=Leucoraja erinaceus TaxID=7782 RepID=UPI002457ED1D|nr:dual specificity protein phosphatase 14-like [Leucoraja erinacea]